jgi:hypothetical protein
MNANLKAPNNTAVNTVSSFVTAPVNSVKNAANNIANSVKNVINNSGVTEMLEPLNDSIQVTMENTRSPFVSIPIIIALGIFIVLFIIVVIFRQEIATGLEIGWNKLKSWMGLTTPAVQAPPPEFVPHPQEVDQTSIEKILPGKKQAFNVAENKYTYSDADALCKAYGAELATYDQVKDAWRKGADWCNYGWIKGQSAIYPTQESTFEKLQAGPEDQKLSCGLPGINGGYFDNPELQFGVNCYGTKPSEKDQDSEASMKDKINLTPDAIALDKKILGYKSQLNQIPVNPFKPGTWSS